MNYDDLERVEEFVWDLRTNYPKIFKQIVHPLFEQVAVFKDINELLENKDLYNDIVASVLEYLHNEATHIEGYDIAHDGCDEWSHEDGIWYSELYVSHDWYFYRDPEGQKYGLYSSIKQEMI